MKHTTPELEEIADIPEPVIDLTEEDLIIDIPEEEKVTGQLEEITGLQEVIPSTIIVEDENPPLHIQKDYHDDILDITARVDAVNTIKVIEDSAHDKLHKEKEERIFEGIPEPLKSHKSNDKIQIKESYIDSAKDEENKEIKGKIYFDKNIDALVIEDISEDEELVSEEQHEKEFALSNDELKADGIKHDDVFVDKEIPSKAEFKIKKPDTDIITIEIPPEVRNKIEEKDIEDFQFINLDEAEQIASEDILILSEDDLIEELDEYDLIPVESAVDEKKSKDRKKEKIEVHHNTKIVQPEKKANVTPPEPKLSEQITITPDKESKKAELKKIEDKKISKDEAITERKLDELKVVTEEIIEEVPKKETETSKEPPKKTQSSMTKTDNIEFIALEEEISKEPKVNATATIKEASGTEQLMKDYTRLKTETIPDDLARAITPNQKILIIDDTGVNVQQQLLAQENPIDEIDRLVSGMI
ncbi:MAG: hypothetical protein N3F66_02575, partial [Spirochaetes bacterium]|nr:hypothetical protein [Spirochaetota bacterium]